MSKQLTVSNGFDNYVEIFLQNDKEGEQHLEKAAGNFCSMLEAQEAAKAEYQEVTGKVHGFNRLWADRTDKTIGTIEQYNHLAKHSAELRKNLTKVKISSLTKHFLSAYASASPEAQEYVERELEAGESVSPKQIREWDATPVEVEKWDEDELREALKRNPVKKVVYGVKDLPKLTANTLHGGLLLADIMKHIDITPEQFAHALAREVTHDGNRPRSALVVSEFTARLDMYMDLIVQTKGLLDTKPKLKVV